MTLKSFEVWHQKKFVFNARSKSQKQLKNTLWFCRGWNKQDIKLIETAT